MWLTLYVSDPLAHASSSDDEEAVSFGCMSTNEKWRRVALNTRWLLYGDVDGD